MFDHVTLRVADRARSEPFFTEVLETLGVDQTYSTNAFAEWRDFSLAEADAAHPATKNIHIGFLAPTREQVDAFWAVGRASGGVDDGAPGPRPQYVADYYGAFLRDPDGNSVEAVHHARQGREAVIDHVWIRVADVAAAAAFYRTIAPAAGLELRHESSERATFGCGAESFSLVPGAALTENAHIAFKGDEDAVRRFHADATAAGYRSNGQPGERPQYHPGYYAAYVTDPDGHNIEVVDHHTG
ncbi:VOC family protein [Baekduia alba]|uniref:VOC family protein n=1 Tax=Baekduia alba TaxID=2997333 RepID=UPI00233F9C0F|nr:VOC family protein [Baekduia alba]